MSSIFSIIFNNNIAPVWLNVTILILKLKKMEIDCNFKKNGQFFQVVPLRFGKIVYIWLCFFPSSRNHLVFLSVL